jgi:hypothetical protein
MKNSKSILKSFGVIAIAIAGMFSVATFSSCSKSTEKLLQQTAEEVNKKCPMRIDPNTTLDSVGVPSATKFQYYYSVNFGAQQISKENYAQLIDQLTPGIVSQVKSNKDASFGILKNLGVTFGYTYYDKDGDLIGDVSVGPEAYK